MNRIRDGMVRKCQKVHILESFAPLCFYSFDGGLQWGGDGLKSACLAWEWGGGSSLGLQIFIGGGGEKGFILLPLLFVSVASLTPAGTNHSMAARLSDGRRVIN